MSGEPGSELLAGQAGATLTGQVDVSGASHVSLSMTAKEWWEPSSGDEAQSPDYWAAYSDGEEQVLPLQAAFATACVQPARKPDDSGVRAPMEGMAGDADSPASSHDATAGPLAAFISNLVHDGSRDPAAASAAGAAAASKHAAPTTAGTAASMSAVIATSSATVGNMLASIAKAEGHALPSVATAAPPATASASTATREVVAAGMITAALTPVIATAAISPRTGTAIDAPITAAATSMPVTSALAASSAATAAPAATAAGSAPAPARPPVPPAVAQVIAAAAAAAATAAAAAASPTSSAGKARRSSTFAPDDPFAASAQCRAATPTSSFANSAAAAAVVASMPTTTVPSPSSPVCDGTAAANAAAAAGLLHVSKPAIPAVVSAYDVAAESGGPAHVQRKVSVDLSDVAQGLAREPSTDIDVGAKASKGVASGAAGRTGGKASVAGGPAALNSQKAAAKRKAESGRPLQSKLSNNLDDFDDLDDNAPAAPKKLKTADNASAAAKKLKTASGSTGGAPKQQQQSTVGKTVPVKPPLANAGKVATHATGKQQAAPAPARSVSSTALREAARAALQIDKQPTTAATATTAGIGNGAAAASAVAGAAGGALPSHRSLPMGSTAQAAGPRLNNSSSVPPCPAGSAVPPKRQASTGASVQPAARQGPKAEPDVSAFVRTMPQHVLAKYAYTCAEVWGYFAAPPGGGMPTNRVNSLLQLEEMLKGGLVKPTMKIVHLHDEEHLTMTLLSALDTYKTELAHVREAAAGGRVLEAPRLLLDDTPELRRLTAILAAYAAAGGFPAQPNTDIFGGSPQYLQMPLTRPQQRAPSTGGYAGGAAGGGQPPPPPSRQPSAALACGLPTPGAPSLSAANQEVKTLASVPSKDVKVNGTGNGARDTSGQGVGGSNNGGGSSDFESDDDEDHAGGQQAAAGSAEAVALTAMSDAMLTAMVGWPPT